MTDPITDAARVLCLDCGRHYGDRYGFPDLNVSDEVWAIICPERAPGGLLCPSCMCGRAYRAGIRAVAYFASGPFEQDGCPTPSHDAPQAPADPPAGVESGQGRSGAVRGVVEYRLRALAADMSDTPFTATILRQFADEAAQLRGAYVERERRVRELIDTIAVEYPDRSGVIQSIVARLREALDPTTPDRK